MRAAAQRLQGAACQSSEPLSPSPTECRSWTGVGRERPLVTEEPYSYSCGPRSRPAVLLSFTAPVFRLCGSSDCSAFALGCRTLGSRTLTCLTPRLSIRALAFTRKLQQQHLRCNPNRSKVHKSQNSCPNVQK